MPLLAVAHGSTQYRLTPDSTVNPATLAIALEAAISRLGELGQPGLDAFNDLMATRGECPEFDAGIDLLGGWSGNESED